MIVKMKRPALYCKYLNRL